MKRKIILGTMLSVFVLLSLTWITPAQVSTVESNKRELNFDEKGLAKPKTKDDAGPFKNAYCQFKLNIWLIIESLYQLLGKEKIGNLDGFLSTFYTRCKDCQIQALQDFFARYKLG